MPRALWESWSFNPSEGMSVDIVTKGTDEQEALVAIEKFLVCE